MSDPNADLAARVKKLEGDVNELIQNLRLNNTDLYKIVDDWVELTNPGEEVRALSARLKLAIGFRNPPGCVGGGN